MSADGLTPATLLRRYKRFLADVRLEDGTELTVHCPNSGRMTACWAEGVPCRLRHSSNPKRKLAWTLEQTFMNDTWVLVDTSLPNKIVEGWIRDDRIEELTGYPTLEREVKEGTSRIDLRLLHPDRPPCWVEVKNVTLLHDDGVLRFPDAVSDRALKHVHALVERVEAGERGVLFFHVGRGDGSQVEPADHVDPRYGAALRDAAQRGVEVIAGRLQLSPAGKAYGGPVSVVL
ncbi:MAG: DNA/RNA nuclease SfsA [Myxococcota bacterium]